MLEDEKIDPIAEIYRVTERYRVSNNPIVKKAHKDYLRLIILQEREECQPLLEKIVDWEIE